MGFLGRIRGKDKDMAPIISELEALKVKISKIPKTYPTYALVVGPGARTAKEQIPLICGSIDGAIRALQTGLISEDNPVPKGVNRTLFASDFLKLSVNKTKSPAFIGLVSTTINPDGIVELKKYMDELAGIAEKVRGA